MKKNPIHHQAGLSLFILLTCFFIAEPANAARVYLSPQPGVHQIGDSVNFSVIVDTEGQSINAVEIGVRIPALFRIKNVTRDGSAIQLWITEPSFTGNTVQFTGGIPGGLNTARAVIGKILMEASAVGEGNVVFLANSSVLLNDGVGTKLELGTASGPAFKVIPRPKGSPAPTAASPQDERERPDEKQPQKFQIFIGTDPRVFNGRRFVSFFTTDAESGVDHYEIKLGQGSFKIAKSPYLIDNLEKRTVIRVRAYDDAGNYRESVYPGFLRRIWWWILNFLSG